MEYEYGDLKCGQPQPFKLNMLWDVVRQLHPSMEQIFWAWSAGLDYNIGTAAHTFAAMTALCESFNIRVGDWMCKPPGHESVHDMIPVPDAASPSLPQRQQDHENSTPQERPPDMDDSEWAKLQKQQEAERRALMADQKLVEFPQLVGSQGFTPSEIKVMLKSMERQRRATAKYRYRCTVDGNSELRMDDPIRTITQVMSQIKLPSDATPVEVQQDEDRRTMPLYPSCIVGTTVQLSILHSSTAIVNWVVGETVSAKVVSEAASGELGVKRGINFAKHRNGSGSGGACQWDTAWLRQTDIQGWKCLADLIIRNTTNLTPKLFDMPPNNLRDLLYFTSTRDNARRCTEEPHLPPGMRSSEAFVSKNGRKLGTDFYNIRMRGVRDTRTADLVPCMSDDNQAAARHPYSHVADLPLQRSCDYALNHGRFPAMMPVLSNNVVLGAPVRLVRDGDKVHVELNTAAAFDHTKMIAEAVLRCSMVEGLSGMQEEFVDGVQGPNGLCVGSKEAEAASAQAPAAAAAGPSSSTDSSPPPVEKDVTTLPYSYDLPSISLTLDAMARIFDPVGRAYYEQMAEAYGDSLDFRPEFEERPHMCTRFVGYSTKNRLLVSHLVPETKDAAFDYIEAGDSESKEAEADGQEVTHSLVSLALGHEAEEGEMHAYRQARAGSRAMSGVKGDLLSTSTWLQHSSTSLVERGMVSGEDDVVLAMVADEPYGLRQRLAELGSTKINALVDKHPEMVKARTQREGDEELRPDALRIALRKRQQHVRNQLYETMPLSAALEPLRHYGPLRLMNRRFKLTYANAKADAIKKRKEAEAAGSEGGPSAAGPSQQKKFANAGAALHFADALQAQKRACSMGRPRPRPVVVTRGPQLAM